MLKLVPAANQPLSESPDHVFRKEHHQISFNYSLVAIAKKLQKKAQKKIVLACNIHSQQHQ